MTTGMLRRERRPLESWQQTRLRPSKVAMIIVLSADCRLGDTTRVTRRQTRQFERRASGQDAIFERRRLLAPHPTANTRRSSTVSQRLSTVYNRSGVGGGRRTP